jgi:peptidoglycan/xylan/chitin deacetylase (PgdA/CDA1 family)
MLATRLKRLIARKIRVRPHRMAASRPIASFSFDDFPKSAWTVGGPILARYGVRGTYYTAGNFCGRTVDGTEFYDAEDLRALAAAGHEIACHGYGHQPVPTLSDTALAVDAARNTEFLRPFLNGGTADSYAFPFGAVSCAGKKFLGHRFGTARGVHAGVNSGTVDLAQLQAVSVETRNWNSAHIADAMAKAVAENAWMIFYTHDVSDDPSPYGATPAMMIEVLEGLKAAGIEALPVREAAKIALA